MADPAAADVLADFLGKVVAGLGLGATVRVEEDDERLVGTLSGEDLELFIGIDGETIDAVQYLSQRIIHVRTGEMHRVVVDADGYRAQRRETIEHHAQQAAADAVLHARPVALDAMPPADRRLAHEYLRDQGGVKTHSEGDEPHRHLVVSPAGA